MEFKNNLPIISSDNIIIVVDSDYQISAFTVKDLIKVTRAKDIQDAIRLIEGDIEQEAIKNYSIYNKSIDKVVFEYKKVHRI